LQILVQFYIDDYPFLTAKIKYVYELYIKISDWFQNLISNILVLIFVKFALISFAEYGIIIFFCFII